MFDMGDDGRGFDGFGSNPAVSIGLGAASMGMGGIVQQGEFSRQSMSQGIPIPRPNALVDEVQTSFKLYNLYPQMSTVPSDWPVLPVVVSAKPPAT